MANHSNRAHRSGRAGFTLVELLVVIGIIAVLIGILLPSLSAARRSAMQVKCAAALQEIGIGFQQYSSEMGGWFPPAKVIPGTVDALGTKWGDNRNNYYIGVNGDEFTSALPAYWQNFIADYVNASKIGNALGRTANSGSDMAVAEHSVIWGCPAWEAYQNYTSAVQTGYGMNHCPAYDPDMNPANLPYNPPASLYNEITGTVGRAFKQVEYTHSADRVLVGDAIFWIVESQPAATGSLPPPVSKGGQPSAGNAVTYNGGGDQTLVDIYRHGKKPSVLNPGTTNAVYDPNGGKIGYNLLFCDGHVAELSEAMTAYKSYRMCFPN